MTRYAYHKLKKNEQSNPTWIEDYQQEMVLEHSIDKENLIIEYQPPTEVMCHPESLLRLIDYTLTPNDILMISELEDLGNNTSQIADILNRCHELMIPVVFTSLPDVNLFDMKLNVYNTILTLSEIDKFFKKCINIKRCQVANDNGNLLGRPNGSKHKHLVQKLRSQGYKQIEVSKIIEVSLSTVKRYWNKVIIE